MLHLVDDIFWHLGFKSAKHAEKVVSQILDVVIIAMIMIILIITGLSRKENESSWVNKRDSIQVAEEIRELGAGYRQKLRDGWVQYLLAGSAGQSVRRVEVGLKEKRVVPVDM